MFKHYISVILVMTIVFSTSTISISALDETQNNNTESVAILNEIPVNVNDEIQTYNNGIYIIPAYNVDGYNYFNISQISYMLNIEDTSDFIPQIETNDTDCLNYDGNDLNWAETTNVKLEEMPINVNGVEGTVLGFTFDNVEYYKLRDITDLIHSTVTEENIDEYAYFDVKWEDTNDMVIIDKIQIGNKTFDMLETTYNTMETDQNKDVTTDIGLTSEEKNMMYIGDTLTFSTYGSDEWYSAPDETAFEMINSGSAISHGDNGIPDAPVIRGATYKACKEGNYEITYTNRKGPTEEIITYEIEVLPNPFETTFTADRNAIVLLPEYEDSHISSQKDPYVNTIKVGNEFKISANRSYATCENYDKNNEMVDDKSIKYIGETTTLYDNETKLCESGYDERIWVFSALKKGNYTFDVIYSAFGSYYTETYTLKVE